MTMFIPGSEVFSSRPVDPDELQRSLPSTLQTHTVSQEQVDGLDPLTYEVIRHRLWSVTDEMGEALKRMSGSPIVTDANDFDFAICDELGQEVQVGLYNTMLVGAVDLAIYWTLRNRAANPGIAEGDMFLCNDPWVGGGLHQNDVIVYQPVFYDGKLFAWTSAIAHQPDLGGVGLGSFSPAAQDVFSESLPTPPVKIVRDGQLQRDVADLWVRRSRVPMLIGLDLRAKIGANNVGRERLLALISQYGADTVKAVMKRMMSDAEARLRGKLAQPARRQLVRNRIPGPVPRRRPRPAQDHGHRHQSRRPPDLRLHRHRPPGRRHQLHLRRHARRRHARAAAHPGR